jgi:hypothetical protein
MPDWDGEEVVAEQTTPNGWVITYEPKPKRRYLIDGVETDGSVTGIERILAKDALPWWGQNVGIAGLLQMRQMGLDIDALIEQKPAEMEWVEYAKLISSGPLTKHQLTTNHVRDAAGTRGYSVHDALQRYATTGSIPDPKEYPPHEQGYVIALVAFLFDVPSLEPENVELMVGSKEHNYAGRYDLRGSTGNPHRVVTKVYPKQGAKTTTIPRGSIMWDLKTSVDIFPEHSFQLGAYELASIECGYEPTDYQVVIQCGADGRYQARRSWASGEDFLMVKACWETYRRVEEALKIPYR